MIRDKIKGMIIGGAIGDALGMAVETWTPEKINEVHPGGVKTYVKPIGHKWFKEETPLGTTTDDTQFKIATMQGFIDGQEAVAKTLDFDHYHDAIAKAHVDAMAVCSDGSGKTTKESIRRLSNGVHWAESGKTNAENRGTGNGVPMKSSAFAAWISTNFGKTFNSLVKDVQFNQELVKYSAMTHYTQMSAEAAIIHTNVVWHCLYVNPQYFHLPSVVNLFAKDVWSWQQENTRPLLRWDASHLTATHDKLKDRMQLLANLALNDKLHSMTTAQIRETFGGGSCYVYDSLPFAYAFFLKNPPTLDSIIETVNAGGDADTNASIVGELIGAIHGIEYFERPENRWAMEGLQNHKTLLAFVDKFCDTLK